MKQLNDEQIINDVLSEQKELAKLYMNAILESNCPKMRSTLGPVHMDIAEKQFDCFQYMEKNNLYPVDYAQPQKVTETINKFASL
ncbi:MAG: spore coat protein [Clostridia bacterium]|nr:spore coat protein [Clostridia bacterium]